MSEKNKGIIKLAVGVGTAVAAIFGGIVFIVKKIIPKKAAEEVTEADAEADTEEDTEDTDE